MSNEYAWTTERPVRSGWYFYQTVKDEEESSVRVGYICTLLPWGFTALINEHDKRMENKDVKVKYELVANMEDDAREAKATLRWAGPILEPTKASELHMHIVSQSIAEELMHTEAMTQLGKDKMGNELSYRANEIMKALRKEKYDEHFIYCLIGLLWRTREMYGDLLKFCLAHKDIINSGTHNYDHVLNARVEG